MLGLVLATLVPLAPQTAADWRAPLSPELLRVVPELKRLAREALETREPHTGLVGAARFETVFDGSYDYHSCVAGHWALLSMARLTGDEELSRWLVERLGPEALDRELASLDALEKEPFTFPYEHAWLALLLSELERHEGVERDAVRAARGWVEQRVLEALERMPFPEEVPPRAAGGVGYCGFYRSWLMAFLLLQLSEPVSEGAAARLEALRAETLEPRRAEVRAHDQHHDFDFLHVPALLALVDRTAPDGTAPERSPYTLDEAPALPERVRLSTVHVLGVALSTVWPCGVDGAAGDEEARELFERTYLRLLERGELWSDDFAVVSHWVPQFLWLGMWLTAGRP